MAAWSTGSGANGLSKPLAVQIAEVGELHGIEITPDGKSLVGMSRGRGLIQRAEIDPSTGKLRAGSILAWVNSPSSLAVLYS